MNKVLIPLLLIFIMMIPISAYGETNTNSTGVLDERRNITPEYANKLIEDNLVWSMKHYYKEYSTNVNQINKWADRINLITQTCYDRYVDGEYLLMSVCNNFAMKYNQHLKQLFNESRTEIEKILLDYLS